ncbi:hypothetical protein G5V58_17840 [Nocardioides anomalus]|uniref:GH26 domain-containing protein n=1 Tax=Nocardioides anomalus TaxID=2712223 RepID=A0A6G6WH54_9ACTN|nr:hypothetical protein [Nocardioides anomalus]QIG44390.1 hypothetical protein G5V58_17840 [Nocardioides anomalus]
MTLSRRGVLSLGGALALSPALSACRSADRGTDRVRIRPSPTPTLAPSPPAATFAGAPAPGQVYFGSSVAHHESIGEWEGVLGSTLALRRSFFAQGRNQPDKLVTRAREDLAAGRLPHVSVKPNVTWAAIADGDHDGWLDSMLTPLGALGAPVLLSVHHEPENDTGPDGMRVTDWVAMQLRVLERAAEQCPQVTVVPILQHWTFDPLHDDIDPSKWLVPGVAAVGVDIYNSWSPKNGKEWRTFGSKADEVLSWTGGAPLVVGEYGCQDDPSNPGLAADWLVDAAEYAREHGIVAMSYFNSVHDASDGSYALRGETEVAFAELLASDWVARLT